MLGRLVFFTAGAAVGAIAAWKLAVEPWYREWGVATDDVMKALPGDDLVPDASAVDTRALEIAAPPESVWPWLVQMGYGRAGWYSYDAMDMDRKSAAEIVPDWQSLAVGDLVRTTPDGGFEVRALDPGRSLVLYLDGEMITAQAKAAQAARAAGEAAEATPANLKATGSMLGAGFPSDFAASWAFDLEPLEGGRTRLVERFRARMGDGTPATRLAAPLMGFGVFVMTRRHMLGIRDRVEGRGGEAAEPEAILA